MHRDLKLENNLFVGIDKDAGMLKATDIELSIYYKSVVWFNKGYHIVTLWTHDTFRLLERDGATFPELEFELKLALCCRFACPVCSKSICDMFRVVVKACRQLL